MQAKATEGVISQPVSEQADAGPPTVLTAQPQKTPPSMPTPRQRHSQVDESKPGLLGREAKIGDGARQSGMKGTTPNGLAQATGAASRSRKQGCKFQRSRSPLGGIRGSTEGCPLA